MIDLTPLDVRKKKGDFRRGIRGYEPQHVDDFLDTVADRLETLAREHHAAVERAARLEEQVKANLEREKALTDALVTAQTMREEVRAQSMRESEILLRQAEQDAARIRAEADQARIREEQGLHGLRARQLQFLAGYRAFLEQELNELGAYTKAIELQRASAAAQAAPPPAFAPPEHVAPAPAMPPAVPVAPPASSVMQSTPATPAPAPHAAGTADALPAFLAPPSAVPEPRIAPPARPASGAQADEIDERVSAAFMEWAGGATAPEAEAEDADLLLSDDDVVGSPAVAPWMEEDPTEDEEDGFDDVDFETPLFGVPDDSPLAAMAPASSERETERTREPAHPVSWVTEPDDTDREAGHDTDGDDLDAGFFLDPADSDDAEADEELAHEAPMREDDAWALFSASDAGDLPRASNDRDEAPADASDVPADGPDLFIDDELAELVPDVAVSHGRAGEPSAREKRPDLSAAFGDHEPGDDGLINLNDFEALRDLPYRQTEDAPKGEFTTSFGLTLRDVFGKGEESSGSGQGGASRGR